MIDTTARPGAAVPAAWTELVRRWGDHPRRDRVLGGKTLSAQIETPDFRCTLILEDGRARLDAGSHVRPDFLLCGDADAMGEILGGTVDITQAVARGRVRVERGPFLGALGLSRMFTSLAREAT